MDSCDFYTTLGKKLRARRRTKHMTLSDLSKKLNKSVATISKYEKGEVLISIDTLVDICQILNIDIASLLPITSTDKSAAEIARYQNYFLTNFIFIGLTEKRTACRRQFWKIRICH